MEIAIEGNDASEYLKETSKIRWTSSLRRQYLGTLIFFLFGVLILTIGVSSDNTMSMTTYKYDNNFTTEYTTKYDYHISLGLGIGFMLIAVYFVYIIYRQKRKFFLSIAKICSRHRQFSDNFSIKVNNDRICYRDFELIHEQKWSTLSHYRVYKDDLLLFQDDFYISSIVIQKARLSEKDYSDLLNFVKSKLPAKKW
jgi:hypothetical protein